jgi:hypothetical protein
MNSKMLIGADIVPTNSNIDKFENGDVNYLIVEKLKNRFEEASFIAMNP